MVYVEKAVAGDWTSLLIFFLGCWLLLSRTDSLRIGRVMTSVATLRPVQQRCLPATERTIQGQLHSLPAAEAGYA
jgi:hypothetical protein